MNSYKNNNDTILAGFSVRALAYIIDCLIVLAIQGILSLILLFANIFGVGGFLYKPILFKYSAWGIILYIISAVYFTFTTYSSGATLGKSLLKLKVVSSDDKSLNFIDILYRETIGRYLSSIFFVGYLMIAGTKDNTALHDRLCKTRVIYTKDAFKTISAKESTCQEQIFETEISDKVAEKQTYETIVPLENEDNKINKEFASEIDKTIENDKNINL